MVCVEKSLQGNGKMGEKKFWEIERLVKRLVLRGFCFGGENESAGRGRGRGAGAAVRLSLLSSGSSRVIVCRSSSRLQEH